MHVTCVTLGLSGGVLRGAGENIHQETKACELFQIVSKVGVVVIIEKKIKSMFFSAVTSHNNNNR